MAYTYEWMSLDAHLHGPAIHTAGYDLRDPSATINDYRVSTACENYGTKLGPFSIGAQVLIQDTAVRSHL